MGQSGNDDAAFRAMRVLDLVSTRRDLTSARQVGDLLGLPKSSVYRIIQSLQRAGALQYDSESGNLRLGPRITRIGALALDGLDIRQKARQSLEDLVAQTGETTSLSVRFGDTRTYIDVVEGPNILSVRPPMGRPLPLLVGAPGRALSFPLHDEEIEELLRRTSLNSYTTNTPVSAEDVWAGIREARESGFAVARDEVISGLATISAPVLTADGEVVAAISISGPSTRLSFDALVGFAEPLQVATTVVAESLNGRAFS